MNRRFSTPIKALFCRISMMAVLFTFLAGSVWGQTYCTSYGNTTYQTSVTLVDFNTISQSSAKPSGYSDYTSASTSISRLSSFGLTVHLNTDGPYTVWARAWIDWDQDGGFTDVGEQYDLGSSYNTSNGATSLSPVSIAIPANATLGVTRMRISGQYNSYPTPCQTYFDGEVEDYSLIITAPIPGATITETFKYTGSTQTFTVPNCVTSITVEAWGGGGGGYDGDNSGGGAGGGGGGYARSIIINPTGAYQVTVGAGGDENSNGTASTFATNLVIADYGRGGTNQTNGIGAGGSSNTGDNTANGGSGGSGSGNSDVGGGGGGGGAGGPVGAGLQGSNGASGVGGNGGTGDNGSGGAGGAGGNGLYGADGGNDPLKGGGGGGGGDNGYAGGNGGLPGGGGGGGENNGGAGANGQVRITYTLPSNPAITLSNTTVSLPYNISQQNATFSYSGTSGCPDLYSIDFTSGIPDVTDASLSGSPITVTAPAGLAVGTYNGTLTVTNSIYGFVSGTYSIQVEVTGTCVLTFTTGPGNTDVSCFSGTDGTIQVTITSPDHSPYTFSADNGTLYNVTFTGSYPNYTLTGLAAGTHKIRIKDTSGCESVVCP